MQHTLEQRIADNIIKLLQQRDMSYGELSRATGINRSSISRKLDGEYHLSLEDVDKIAQALQLTPSDLLNQGKAA